MCSRFRRVGLPVLCAVAIEGALLAVASIADLRSQVPLFWVLMGTAFAAYFAAAFWALQYRQVSLPLTLIAAAVFRITLLPTTPTLSDDIYRYVWDARVQLAGHNPYRFAPQDPALSTLRDELYAGINHKDVATIYPPMAQLLFVVAAAAGPSVMSLKLALVACEGVLLLILVQLLRRTGRDDRRVLLYAWNPLVLIEIAASGHVDVLGVTLLLLSVLWMIAGHRTAAAAALAAAVLSKLVPLLALPLFWHHYGVARGASARNALSLQNRWPLLLVPALVIAAYGLYGSVGSRLFDGLFAYVSRWRFNDVAFAFVLELARAAGLDNGLDHTCARLACATAVGVCALVAAVMTDPLRALFVVVGLFTLLSPTLHPWYLVWIVAFLPFFPNIAWLALSGLVFLAYEVLARHSSLGVWEEQTWVRWAEFAPFYALLILSPIVRRFLHRR